MRVELTREYRFEAAHRLPQVPPDHKCFRMHGHSFVVDPFGRYVAEAGEREEVLIAQCDPALIETVRRNWPFLRDRRIDAYGPILSRYLGV